MNVNSRHDTSTKTLRRFIATVLAALFVFSGVAPVAGATITVFDSLGTATPASQFVATTTGGHSILEDQFVGVQFTVTQPTTLTEIGGFVNKLCGPVCSATPLTVQIRPAVNGVPDLSTVRGSFSLTDDGDPTLVSYESVLINLPLQLEPGTYFALFAPHDDDEGSLISNAFLPFFQAPSVTLGILKPLTGISFAAEHFAAVRILGEIEDVPDDVFIDGCDSGITDVVLPGGSTISGLVAECGEGATNHGEFVSCIAHLANDLNKNGNITTQQKSALRRCAAQADIP